MSIIAFGGIAFMLQRMNDGGSEPDAAQPNNTSTATSEVKTAESAVVAVEAPDGMKDVLIANADALEEGTMQEVRVGDGPKDKVLVVRYNG